MTASRDELRDNLRGFREAFPREEWRHANERWLLMQLKLRRDELDDDTLSFVAWLAGWDEDVLTGVVRLAQLTAETPEAAPGGRS